MNYRIIIVWSKMKKVLIKMIRIYQSMPISSHGACKFIPSCSNYAIEAINEYGCIKGSFMAIKRILRCNPFNKGGIDLVPKKELKK